MNFMEAVKAMKEGKKVRRKDSESLYRLKSGMLQYYSPCMESWQNYFNVDVVENDWEIVEDKKDYNLLPVCPTCWKKGQIQ